VLGADETDETGNFATVSSRARFNIPSCCARHVIRRPRPAPCNVAVYRLAVRMSETV